MTFDLFQLIKKIKAFLCKKKWKSGGGKGERNRMILFQLHSSCSVCVEMV